jgi:hypothetical protein
MDDAVEFVRSHPAWSALWPSFSPDDPVCGEMARPDLQTKKDLPIMNNIATDMSRLCGEIAALRDSRAELRRNLAEATEGLHEEVSRLLTGFGEARAEMSKQTQAELHEVVLHVKDAVTALQNTVAGLRGAFLEDMEGARRAWAGASSASTHVPMAAGSATKAKKKKR